MASSSSPFLFNYALVDPSGHRQYAYQRSASLDSVLLRRPLGPGASRRRCCRCFIRLSCRVVYGLCYREANLHCTVNVSASEPLQHRGLILTHYSHLISRPLSSNNSLTTGSHDGLHPPRRRKTLRQLKNGLMLVPGPLKNLLFSRPSKGTKVSLLRTPQLIMPSLPSSTRL